jgi:asparagine synthase (glutamine-hydrolysing)
MIRKVHHIRQLWHYFGPEWLAYRLSYAARLRMGLLRHQIPVTEWADQPLSNSLSSPTLAESESYLKYRHSQAPPFFFNPSHRENYRSYFAGWDGEAITPMLLGDEIARGTLRYFEHTTAQVGFPPDWHSNPFSGQKVPADRHWSRINDFGYGDIKIIWEPSRFGFVYALVRAYWRTGDERYAESFWELVEDWRARNPPQRGPNWKCGQETSFRVMAWCFGLYGFLDAPATTAERVTALAQMMAVSGRRIEANLSYALSQRNNHGLSEGMGLWTIGLLFPELRFAAKWREIGRQVLETLGQELIYDDGAFVQHSANYHRLMLHDYLWALRLGDLHGQPFSAELRERVGTAGAFLYQIQDGESGRVPCYGSNDGALILPLNNCDYRDFRPALQAIHYFCIGARCYGSGPWDEDLLWLFGPEALKSPVAAPHHADLQAKVGGCYTLRSKTGFAFVRCANFRHRPGHADMLHIDLWWRGQNVALDAGTFSYNAPSPWDESLGYAAYHNTVTVDGLDQMDRVGKFLWLPWLHSGVRWEQGSPGGHLSYWEGEHDGYQRLKVPVSHRRGVLRLADEWWLVLDRLASRRDHRYRLHWLFPAVPYEWDGDSGRLTLHTLVGPYYVQMATLSGGGNCSLIQADEHSPRGWRAPYYYHREPALSVDLVAQADSLTFWTLFGPELCQVIANGRTLHVETEQWQGVIQLPANIDEQRSLVASVSVAGALEDRLEIASCMFS